MENGGISREKDLNSMQADSHLVRSSLDFTQNCANYARRDLHAVQMSQYNWSVFKWRYDWSKGCWMELICIQSKSRSISGHHVNRKYSKQWMLRGTVLPSVQYSGWHMHSFSTLCKPTTRNLGTQFAFIRCQGPLPILPWCLCESWRNIRTENNSAHRWLGSFTFGSLDATVLFTNS